jgi:hypothetical protein
LYNIKLTEGTLTEMYVSHTSVHFVMLYKQQFLIICSSKYESGKCIMRLGRGRGGFKVCHKENSAGSVFFGTIKT